MELPGVKPEAKEQGSLWDSFLKDAARASYKYGEATLIVCGEKTNPFAEIIHSMKSSSGRMGRPGQQLPYFLNYRYVDADSEVDEALHLHTWTVQDVSNFEQISTVVPEDHINNGRLGYIMCVDSSKPSTIKAQLDKWSEFIRKAQNLVFEKVGDSKAQEMKDEVSRRIQFYQLGHADETPLDEDEKSTIKLDRNRPKINVGVLVTVVICNTEQFGKNYPQSQAAASRMFDRALLFIRKSCIEIGAAVFTFANRRQGASIKQYIDTMVRGDKVTQQPQVANITLQELKDEQVFIPSGFDSELLLSTSSLEKKKMSFNEVFPDKLKSKARKNAEYKQQSQPDDQHFLALLRFRIEEGKKHIEKLDKRTSVAAMNLPPNVKKYMADTLNVSSRKIDGIRRSSMNLKQRRIGGGRKDLGRFNERERERRRQDTFKAVGLI